MAELRLEKTRKAYRCNRSFVLVEWQHCDCPGCAFARKANKAMREGSAAEFIGLDLSASNPFQWYADLPDDDTTKTVN